MISWEKIDPENSSQRLKVPGGWIVRIITTTFESAHSGSCSVHQIFIEDPEHTWALEEEQRA